MSRPIYKPIEADEAVDHIKAGRSMDVYIDHSGDLTRSDREGIFIEFLFNMSWYLKCVEEEHLDIDSNLPVRPEISI